MILAGLFDLAPLSWEESGIEEQSFFALGHRRRESDRTALVDQAVSLALEEAGMYLKEWASEEERMFVLERAHSSAATFWNDRYNAEGMGYSWCVTEDTDLEPDWKADEENIDELRRPLQRAVDGTCPECGASRLERCDTRDGSQCTDDELKDDWAEIVRRDPDRYPCAPIGPFPGTMVVVHLRRIEKEGAA